MKYEYGNLLALADIGQFDVIIHGCNLWHTMGAGIAKQIAERYPEALAADKETGLGDPSKLGTFSVWHGPKFSVYNAYTQNNYGTNKVHANYQAILSAMRSIREDLKDPYTSVGIPQIGAGLAGGDWQVISALIDAVGFKDLTCVIYTPDKDSYAKTE